MIYIILDNVDYFYDACSYKEKRIEFSIEILLDNYRFDKNVEYNLSYQNTLYCGRIIEIHYTQNFKHLFMDYDFRYNPD